MEVLSSNLKAVFYYGLCSHGVPTTKEPVGRTGFRMKLQWYTDHESEFRVLVYTLIEACITDTLKFKCVTNVKVSEMHVLFLRF